MNFALFADLERFDSRLSRLTASANTRLTIFDGVEAILSVLISTKQVKNNIKQISISGNSTSSNNSLHFFPGVKKSANLV